MALLFFGEGGGLEQSLRLYTSGSNLDALVVSFTANGATHVCIMPKRQGVGKGKGRRAMSPP